jgi:hypothetical protein
VAVHAGAPVIALAQVHVIVAPLAELVLHLVSSRIDSTICSQAQVFPRSSSFWRLNVQCLRGRPADVNQHVAIPAGHLPCIHSSAHLNIATLVIRISSQLKASNEPGMQLCK